MSDSPTTTILGGVDLSKLEHEMPTQLPIPKMVKHRVCHIDADFLAYQVSYDEERAIPDMKHNCDERIEKLRLMSGAEHVKLHLTPKQSDKGGRYEVALLKEYQGNRKDKPKPRFLNLIREWMHKERGAILHANCEADDGMAMEQYKAIAEGNRNLSIIATKDKDLTMVPGLMLDWDTGEITDTGKEPFGYIRLDDSGSQKKVRGRGWKYFWVQMLTGDPADNISGLPMVCTERFLKGKPKKCGTVTAFNILENVNTNKEAFELVRELYKDAGEQKLLRNYRDNSEIHFGKALQSEAQLLWMRRDHDINDAIKWMQEECLG